MPILPLQPYAIALCDAYNKGWLKKGDRVALVGFGAESDVWRSGDRLDNIKNGG